MSDSSTPTVPPAEKVPPRIRWCEPHEMPTEEAPGRVLVTSLMDDLHPLPLILAEAAELLEKEQPGGRLTACIRQQEEPGLLAVTVMSEVVVP